MTDRDYDRLQRLLDERFANLANATQMVVNGLHEDLIGQGERLDRAIAMLDELRAQLAANTEADRQREAAIQALTARRRCDECPWVGES